MHVKKKRKTDARCYICRIPFEISTFYSRMYFFVVDVEKNQTTQKIWNHEFQYNVEWVSILFDGNYTEFLV